MVTKVALVVLVVLGAALAVPADPYRSQPVHPPAYHQDLMPYQFEYGVKDEYSGNDYSQNEVSDGKAVTGSYTVQLPDGRKQTVNYVADHYNGYQAEVSYYGEAQYPHEYGPPVTYKPQHGSYQPKPSYQPRPSYQPKPSYQPRPSYQPKPSYQPRPSYH